MRAWRFTAPHQPLTMMDVPEPKIGDDEMVIDVKAAGICHSDIGYLDGTLTELLAFRPITLGHEIVGLVSSVGDEVTAFAPGDRVAIPATVAGPGTGMDGGLADQVKAYSHQVVRVPEGVSWEQAATATCAGLTAYHSLVEGGVGPTTRLGLIGAGGGLGVLAVQFARALGATLFASETNREAWPLLESLGVEHLAENIRAFSNSDLDVVIDFAGFDDTTDDALKTVGFRGTVVQVGLGSPRAHLSTTTMVVKQLRFLGSNGGSNDDCTAVLRMMSEGKASSQLEPFDFAGVQVALERFQRGETRGRLVTSIG